MRYDEAVRLHAAILQRAAEAAMHQDVLIILVSIIKLHIPTGAPAFPAHEPGCYGCPLGDYAEDGNLWEECPTLHMINNFLLVDGYLSGDVKLPVQPSEIVCTPDSKSFCPVHGRCSCRRPTTPPYWPPIRTVSCPLHGRNGTHEGAMGA